MIRRGASAERSYGAEISLVCIAAVWGLTFPMVQDAVALLPVMTFLAYRFLAAATVVAAVSLPELRKLTPAGWKAGAGMGIFLTVGYVFQTLGLERTSSSNVGFITGLFVVLTPIFGAVFLRRRAGALAWAAAGVSAVGLGLLSGFGGDTSHVTGDLLVIVTACSFAMHILVTDRAVQDHDVKALLVVQLGLCGLLSLVTAVAAADIEAPPAASVWLALAVTAFIASALGFFVQTYAQRHSPPERVALILASEPAFAGLFAYLIKGETLAPLQWVGALLILGSIVAVELVPHLRPPQPLPER